MKKRTNRQELFANTNNESVISERYRTVLSFVQDRYKRKDGNELINKRDPAFPGSSGYRAWLDTLRRHLLHSNVIFGNLNLVYGWRKLYNDAIFENKSTRMVYEKIENGEY